MGTETLTASTVTVMAPTITAPAPFHGTSAADMQKLFGRAVLFVFPDVGWSVKQFAGMASAAKALGFDTISPKIGEGTQAWYSLDAVKQQRAAVLAAGCGYAPFWYSVGPKFGIVAAEARMMQQYGDANAGVIISDMETEWDGQVAAAEQFASIFRPWVGTLGVTTWADPIYQNWVGVMAALAPAVNVWIPQRYDNWLASQALPAEATIIQPAVDLSQEFGPNNVTSQVLRIASRGGTAWIWDNAFARANPGLARNLTAILHKG
jgi:hypothetical protein